MAISANGEFMGCPHLDEEGVKCSSIEEYWNKDERLYNHRKKEYVIAFVKFRVSINLRECMMMYTFLTVN